MKKILDYLKKHGECIDTEISAGTGISLATLHQHLSELMAKGEIIACHATRFKEGIKSEVIISRLVGRGPVIKPAKKAKPQLEML